MSQRMDALAIGNAVKADRLRLKRDAAQHPEAVLAELLTDPPAAVAGMPLVDLLRLAPGSRSSRALTVIGRRAANDRINLFVPAGLPSARLAREWCLAHVQWRRSAQGGVRLALRRTA